MYVPVLKNRLYETKFLRENNELFDSDLMPLIEVISLQVGKKKYSIVELIAIYDDTFKSPFFIDFFTFDNDEFQEKDPKQIQFALDIRDEKKYKYLDDLLVQVTKSKHGIPVISIKKIRSFLMDKSVLKKFVAKLQNLCESIAVRIESNLFDDFFETIHPFLRKKDFLFYDINEEPILSKYYDIKKIKNVEREYKLIILYSSRPSKIKNGDYPDGQYTELIDNSLRNEFMNFGFDGFSDYSGLKNVLPTNGGNGTGAALGLFYSDDKNMFFSIKNRDIFQGARGYNYVLYQALKIFENELNPGHSCPCFEYMQKELVEKNKFGVWGLWKYITLLRYISQIKKSTKQLFVDS